MSEKDVRWGIISTSYIGDKAVIPAIVKAGNGHAAAIASRDLDRAKATAEVHGIPTTYGSYEELLADPEIDAVYNPLPNHLHLPWSVEALEAGKHVLCEKPLTITEAESRELAGAAEKAERVLMEASMYRFQPRIRRIKQLVAEGAVGDIRLMRAAFCFNITDPTNVRLDPDMGGGSLLDVGHYAVSVSRWMMDAEPEEVQASAVYGPTGVDVIFTGMLRFPGDRLAVVESSFSSALQQTFTIVGSEGAIDLPHNAFVPVPYDADASFVLRGPDDEDGEVHTVPGADEYVLMVEHFGDVMNGKAELFHTPDDAIRNMRVLEALAVAAREKRVVKL